jgi:hypothetical protein
MFHFPSRNADPRFRGSGENANDDDYPPSSSDDETPDPTEGLNLSLRPVRVAVV